MTLLGILKTNNRARKIFGKKELKIIEKQLLGIILTQSEKNRLSRDIREKLRFVKEISGFSPQFELKKGAEIKRLINTALEFILKDKLSKRINKIKLFGSTVGNKLNFRSDIDISVQFNKITLKEATLFRKRVLGELPEKIDLQVYNILPKKIKTEINDKGKLLYEKN